MEFNYSVILICLGFAVFLIVKEIRRNDTSRIGWRLAASIFMIISLALLIIPITYSTKKLAPAHELNLLTEGTSLDPNSYPKQSIHLADLNYHLKLHPEIRKINVYGYGLSDNELKMLKGYQLSFHPVTIPLGFISVSWPKKLGISAQLIVQGVYHNPTNKAVKLKLTGLGGDLDSLLIKANTKSKFSFSTQPKQIGKAVFNLLALQRKDTLSAEPIPFEVIRKPPIRILILASFPDFEYKFLKKWLYENQYAVAFKSQISKDKYSTEFLNQKAVNLNQINQDLLKTIDLVICDEGELTAAISTAVNNGMGLIVRVNNLPLKKVVDHQPLLKDENGKVVVDSRLSGMGKIITTTIAATYQWQLAGKQVDYSRFWSLLFTKSLRKKAEEHTFEIEPKWLTMDEKVRLMVSVSDVEPPLIFVDSVRIAPRQNMELPFLWDGFFWPKISGWHTLTVNQSVENIYSYKRTDWKAIKNFDKLKTTLNFIANSNKAQLKLEKMEYPVVTTVNKWWFFFIFLTMISFLWYEQRFLANETKML